MSVMVTIAIRLVCMQVHSIGDNWIHFNCWSYPGVQGESVTISGVMPPVADHDIVPVEVPEAVLAGQQALVQGMVL